METGERLPLKDYVSKFDDEKEEEEEVINTAKAMRAEVTFNRLRGALVEVVFRDFGSILSSLLPTTVQLRALQDLPGHCDSGAQGDSSGLAIVVEIVLPVGINSFSYTAFT